MSWLKKLFTGGLGKTVEQIGGVYERIAAGHLGKKEFQLEVERILAADRAALHTEAVAELGAKERILVAELSQGDAYTKRARPTVVYAGLTAIFLNHVVAPWTAYILGQEVPAIELPTQFWAAWAAVVGVWSIGRTAEKRGVSNRATRAITGTSPLGLTDA